MRRCKSLLSRLLVAALVSGLAAILMVTIGPGFAENDGPSENASEQAQANHAADPSANDASSNDEEPNSPGLDQGGNASDEQPGEAVSAASADNGGGSSPDGAPGQTTPKGGDTDLVGGGAGNSEANDQDRPEVGLSEGRGQLDTSPCPNEKNVDSDLSDGDQADENTGNGANQGENYDSTCNGRQSENGQGGGAAMGRPCMGCVGNADNKNPGAESYYDPDSKHYQTECTEDSEPVSWKCGPGQMPSGREHNAGYECDRNNGIGKGNPAHTGCQGGAATPPPPPPQGDEVCRRVAGEWVIVPLQPGEARQPGDRDADSKQCDDSPPPPPQGDEVCRKVSGEWVIVPLQPGEARQPGDLDSDAKQCEDSPPTTGQGDIVCRHVEGEWILVTLQPGEARQPGDRDSDAKQCEDSPPPVVLTYIICHVDGNDFDIIPGLTKDERDDHLDDHPLDFEIKTAADVERCSETPTTQVSPTFIICHVDDDDFDIITGLTEAQRDDHLDNHDDDFEIDSPSDVRRCDEDDDVSPTRLTVCHSTGSTTNPWVVISIPSGDLEEHLAHGDEVVSSGTTADMCAEVPLVLAVVTEWVVVCPDDSDRPGMVLKKGQTAEDCYKGPVDDVAGKQVKFIPAPAVKNIPDRVQPNLIRNRPQPAPKVKGGVLPFTGASVLAFLVLALQLIAAGSLILRGKRA